MSHARGRFREHLLQWCHDDGQANDGVLAMIEAVNNVIRHSGTRRRIVVQPHLEDAPLAAEIRDQGAGFEVDGLKPQLPQDVFSDHGRGLFLISRLCDSFDLRSEQAVTAGPLADDLQLLVPRGTASPWELSIGVAIIEESGETTDGPAVST